MSKATRKILVGSSILIVLVILVFFGFLLYNHFNTGYVITTDTVSLNVTKEEYDEFLSSSDRERVVERLVEKYRR